MVYRSIHTADVFQCRDYKPNISAITGRTEIRALCQQVETNRVRSVKGNPRHNAAGRNAAEQNIPGQNGPWFGLLKGG